MDAPRATIPLVTTVLIVCGLKRLLKQARITRQARKWCEEADRTSPSGSDDNPDIQRSSLSSLNSLPQSTRDLLEQYAENAFTANVAMEHIQRFPDFLPGSFLNSDEALNRVRGRRSPECPDFRFGISLKEMPRKRDKFKSLLKRMMGKSKEKKWRKGSGGSEESEEGLLTSYLAETVESSRVPDATSLLLMGSEEEEEEEWMTRGPLRVVNA